MSVYDLSRERPKVLVTGNGITYNMPWNSLICKIARNQEMAKKYSSEIYKNIPYPLLSLVVGDFDDEIRHEKYISELEKVEYKENEIIAQITKMGFDAILTTNYTHEYEYEIKKEYPGLARSSKLKYAHGKKKNDKFLLETFNKIDDITPELWHIHGDMRNKSSIVLSHDEYARLIKAILNYLADSGDKYEKKFNDFEIRSWIDYFIIADVYILGLGFDFSEFDLWWVLNRRLREKSEIGNIIFYEPERFDAFSKTNVLDDLNVDVRHLGYALPETQNKELINKFYIEFYREALSDIKKEISKNNKTDRREIK